MFLQMNRAGAEHRDFSSLDRNRDSALGRIMLVTIGHPALAKAASCWSNFSLKGLSHEIDFKNVVENGHILALLRAAAGFWIFRRLLWFLVEIKHQFHVGFFKGKLRSQTFFEVPPDCYCTSVNTTWRTACLMQNLSKLFLLDPILSWFKIVRCNRQAALHSAMFNYTPLVIGGADKNKQLTNIKPTQTGINRKKELFEL